MEKVKTTGGGKVGIPTSGKPKAQTLKEAGISTPKRRAWELHIAKPAAEHLTDFQIPLYNVWKFKEHSGDGLYQEAERILGIDQSQLMKLKSIAERYKILLRSKNLTWNHHYEVASLKQTEISGGEKGD